MSRTLPGAAAAARRRGVRSSRRVPHVGTLAWCLLVATLVVVPHVASYLTLSPIDELQHIDATIKGGQLDVVRQGELVGESALREQSCRGIDAPGFVSPPCDAPDLRPGDYQEAGYNTAAGNPPTYYLLTGVVSRALTATGIVGSPVTAARLLGTLWLAAGLVVAAQLCRSLGAHPWPTAGAVTLVAATPVVTLPSATVSPDATSLLAGGIVLLAAVLHLQRRLPAVGLLPAAALSTAPKASGVLAVGVCVLLVAVAARAWTRDAWRAGSRGWLGSVACLGAGGAAPVLLWSSVTRLRALDVPPSPMSRFDVDQLDSGQLLGNVLSLLPPTQAPYTISALQRPLVSVLVGLTGLLVIAALAHTTLSEPDRPAGALSGATLAFMLLGGPLLVVLVFLTAGAYFPIPPRYGLVLLPGAVAAVAVVASRHRGVFACLAALASLQLTAHVLALT